MANLFFKAIAKLSDSRRHCRTGLLGLSPATLNYLLNSISFGRNGKRLILTFVLKAFMFLILASYCLVPLRFCAVNFVAFGLVALLALQGNFDVFLEMW